VQEFETGVAGLQLRSGFQNAVAHGGKQLIPKVEMAAKIELLPMPGDLKILCRRQNHARGDRVANAIARAIA
jgi:hypothetical protein